MRKLTSVRIFDRLNGRQTEREVDEELHFHLEMLHREHLQSGMTPPDARAAILKRFGDLERIRHECMGIRRRNTPVIRMLKLALVLLFIAGVFFRVFSPGRQFSQLGDLSMAIAIFGRLLIYVGSLRPTAMSRKNDRFWNSDPRDTSSALTLRN